MVSITKRVKTLFFPPYKRVGGEEGVGGYPVSVSLQAPTSAAAVLSRLPPSPPTTKSVVWGPSGQAPSS